MNKLGVLVEEQSNRDLELLKKEMKCCDGLISRAVYNILISEFVNKLSTEESRLHIRCRERELLYLVYNEIL